MSQQLKEKPQEAMTSSTDPDLCHWYCMDCYPNMDVAYCGTDISDHCEVGDERDVDCVVCNGLIFCPLCGY